MQPHARTVVFVVCAMRSVYIYAMYTASLSLEEYVELYSVTTATVPSLP